MLMVFGSIWQKVKSGMSSGKTLRTMSSFRGRTNSPKDLLDNVGSGPLEKRRLAAMPELQLLKWDFFQRRKGVTLRSTSIEAVLNGGTGVIFYCFFGHIFPHSGTKTIAMFTSIHAAKNIKRKCGMYDQSHGNSLINFFFGLSHRTFVILHFSQFCHK